MHDVLRMLFLAVLLPCPLAMADECPSPEQMAAQERQMRAAQQALTQKPSSESRDAFLAESKKYEAMDGLHQTCARDARARAEKERLEKEEADRKAKRVAEEEAAKKQADENEAYLKANPKVRQAQLSAAVCDVQAEYQGHVANIRKERADAKRLSGVVDMGYLHQEQENAVEAEGRVTEAKDELKAWHMAQLPCSSKAVKEWRRDVE